MIFLVGKDFYDNRPLCWGEYRSNPGWGLRCRVEIYNGAQGRPGAAWGYCCYTTPATQTSGKSETSFSFQLEITGFFSPSFSKLPKVSCKKQEQKKRLAICSICDAILISKHRKNCEWCPLSLLIVRLQRLSWIPVLNWKICNQWFKCHKSLGM